MNKSIWQLINNTLQLQNKGDAEKIRVEDNAAHARKRRVCCLKAVTSDNEGRRDKRISSSGDEEERGCGGGDTSSKSGRGACTTASGLSYCDVLIVRISFIIGMHGSWFGPLAVSSADHTDSHKMICKQMLKELS